jgi:uncharacterized membrane protein YgcG
MKGAPLQIRRLLTLFLLLFALPLHAQSLPNNGLPIQDTTGKYASNIAALEQAIKDYGLPVKLLLTEPQRQDIDIFSHYLFKEWSLPKDGLLICIFPTSRKVVLTAGPEMEAIGINGAFFRDTVIPRHFKPGWKSGGVVEAVKASLTAIKSRIDSREPDSGKSVAAVGAPAETSTSPSTPQPTDYQLEDGTRAQSTEEGSGAPVLFMVAIAGLIAAFFLRLIRQNGTQRGGQSQSGINRVVNPLHGIHPALPHINHVTHVHSDPVINPMQDTGSASFSAPSAPTPTDMGGGGGGSSDTGSGSF